MPNNTLTFDLTDPDKAGHHRLAINAIHLNAALHRIDEYCRSQIEYGEHDDKTVTTLKAIREMMPEIM